MKLLISCICVFLVIFPAAYAVGIGEEGQTGSSEPPTSPEALQNTISNGGSGDFSFSNPTEVNLPNGEKATVSGNVKVENGKIVSADSIKIENSQMSNARNVQPLPNGGYSAESAVQIQSDTYLLTNAQGVRFENGILTAAKADSFLRFGAISTNINNLESDISSFSVQQADSVVSGCVNVQGIEDSSFKIYSNAVEMESNGNAMEIEDCSFNRMAFSGRKIAISKETPARYRIGNGTLNYTGERYNESLDAGNSTIAEMGAEGFSCLTIKAPGTYWYSENLAKDFGINIPKDEYRLCLRKIAGEPFPNYDGLIDLPDKKITLGKIANYLRQIFRNGKLLALRMLPAYEGHDKDSLADMKLDEGFEKIQTISLSLNRTKTDFNGKVAVLRSGNFEITEEGSARFLKIRRDIIFPDVWEFANSSIHQPNLSATNGILIQRGKNRVIAVTPGSEQQEKAEEFLENYWNRNQGETLADFLESEAYR